MDQYGQRQPCTRPERTAIKYLIIGDPYDRLPRTQKLAPLRQTFDVELLRGWLKYLNITDYDVAWANDAKLDSWTGPVIALGNYATAEAVRKGKWVVQLPHPNGQSTTVADKQKMQAILRAVKHKLSYDYVRPASKIRTIK